MQPETGAIVHLKHDSDPKHTWTVGLHWRVLIVRLAVIMMIIMIIVRLVTSDGGMKVAREAKP